MPWGGGRRGSQGDVAGVPTASGGALWLAEVPLGCALPFGVVAGAGTQEVGGAGAGAMERGGELAGTSEGRRRGRWLQWSVMASWLLDLTRMG